MRVCSVIALLAAGTVGSCDLGEEPLPDPLPDARPELRRAVERTLRAGPSAMSATVRAQGERYGLIGRLDPQRGYRFCGRVRRGGGEFPRGRAIWLEEHGGSYSTLTTAADGCDPAAIWLDDHPPTLQLARTGPGAEDHLHAALTALVGLNRAVGPSAAFEGCGSAECIRGAIDFGALDRRPTARDEDGWTLRPLLRRLGSRPVTLVSTRKGASTKSSSRSVARADGSRRPFGFATSDCPRQSRRWGDVRSRSSSGASLSPRCSTRSPKSFRPLSPTSARAGS